MTEATIRTGYQKFKAEKSANALREIIEKHKLTNESLTAFIDEIMDRMIFDGEKLTDLLVPKINCWF